MCAGRQTTCSKKSTNGCDRFMLAFWKPHALYAQYALSLPQNRHFFARMRVQSLFGIKRSGLQFFSVCIYLSYARRAKRTCCANHRITPSFICLPKSWFVIPLPGTLSSIPPFVVPFLKNEMMTARRNWLRCPEQRQLQVVSGFATLESAVEGKLAGRPVLGSSWSVSFSPSGINKQGFPAGGLMGGTGDF
jgi:hypothetical protein